MSILFISSHYNNCTQLYLVVKNTCFTYTIPSKINRYSLMLNLLLQPTAEDQSSSMRSCGNTNQQSVSSGPSYPLYRQLLLMITSHKRNSLRYYWEVRKGDCGPAVACWLAYNTDCTS